MGVNSSILDGRWRSFRIAHIRIIRNPFDGLNRLVYRELDSSQPHASLKYSLLLRCRGDFPELRARSSRGRCHPPSLGRQLSDHFVSFGLGVARQACSMDFARHASLHGRLPLLRRVRRLPAGMPVVPAIAARAAPLSRESAHWTNQGLRLLQPVFVAPSRWLANECTSSSVASSCRVEVIPYGIDVKAFAPMPQQEARRRLGLDPEALYIMLGAHSLEEQRKGGLLAQQALHELAQHSSTAEAVSTGDVEGCILRR